jgi:hypothetical protein
MLMKPDRFARVRTMLALRGQIISRRANRSREMSLNDVAAKARRHARAALQRSNRQQKDAFATFRKPTLF